MIRSILIAALCGGLGACGTVVHSINLGQSQIVEGAGNECERQSVSRALRDLCDATPYQMYALPISVINVDFKKEKDNRWHVGITTSAQADPDPANWFRLYHQAHPLNSDAITLTVTNNLLNNANATSTPQIVEIVENIRTISDSFAATDSGGDASSDDGDGDNKGADGAPRLDRITLTPHAAQMNCFANTLTDAEPHCTTDAGTVVATFVLQCDATLTGMPGQPLDEPECEDDDTTKRHTRRVGRISLNIAYADSGDGDAVLGDNYEGVRRSIAASYGTIQAGREGRSSVYYRVEAPAFLQGRFRCTVISELSDAIANQSISASIGARSTIASCDNTRFLPARNLNVRDAVSGVGLIVEGPAGHAMSANIDRGVLVARQTDLTFENGVLKTVAVETPSVGLGALLIPLAILGLDAAD